MVKRWRLYYADGSTVEGDGGGPEVVYRFPRRWVEAPAAGVLAVVAETTHRGRYIMSRAEDYYMAAMNTHQEGEISPTHDKTGLQPFIRDMLRLSKSGINTADHNFAEVMERASQIVKHGW